MVAARHVMNLLYSNAYGMNILLRFAVGFLVPFAVQSANFSASEAAMLQGSFFPGYTIAMMPAAMIAGRIGEKAAISINLIGNGLCCLAMPLAARLGAVPLAAIFSTMGVMQSCIVPCLIALQTRWTVKEGTEKVWSTRLVPLTLVTWQMFSSYVTPRLSGRRGFGVTARFYAVLLLSFGTLWTLWAKNRPSEWKNTWPRMLPAEERLLQASDAAMVGQSVSQDDSNKNAAENTAKPQRVQALGIRELLSVGSARAVICAAGGWGSAMYAILPIAPTYFQTELGVNAEQAGSLLAVVPIVQQVSDICIGLVEATLIKAKWSTLAVRKLASCSGYAISAVGLVVFAFAKTARMATVGYCLAHAVATPAHFGSGFGQCYREVGGESSGSLAAACNTLANVSGAILPMVGFALREATGSWKPAFLWPVGVQALTLWMWLNHASCTPARETFDARHAKVAV